MMVGEKVIDAQEDVFYLTMQDLKSFCTEGNRDSKAALIAGLKTRHEKYGTLTLPDRIMYMDGSVPVFDKNKKKVSPQAGTFQGLAVSKGAIDADAVVITEPRLDIDVRGKILVSKITDPGWVFLMAQAAGMVCEKGSLLSHTAIVGRELGIPVVVGVAGATSIFKNGDYLHLDGDAGTVGFKPKAV
jgi:pyruvate,water dikinase